jgi:hypothetical protein
LRYFRIGAVRDLHLGTWDQACLAIDYDRFARLKALVDHGLAEDSARRYDGP